MRSSGLLSPHTALLARQVNLPPLRLSTSHLPYVRYPHNDKAQAHWTAKDGEATNNRGLKPSACFVRLSWHHHSIWKSCCDPAVGQSTSLESCVHARVSDATWVKGHAL